MGAFVEFENVSKIYKTGDVEVHALTDASFEIQKGEFCVIVGESGAGKTTLLNILGGMDTLSKGTVRMDGRDISHFNRTQLENYRRYDIGFVFQFYNLIPNLTALENVEIAAQLCTDAIPAEDVLRAVGLHDRMQNFPAQLSGGEQQRVALARALVNNPKLIIADEPTGNIDPALSFESAGSFVRAKTYFAAHPPGGRFFMSCLRSIQGAEPAHLPNGQNAKPVPLRVMVHHDLGKADFGEENGKLRFVENSQTVNGRKPFFIAWTHPVGFICYQKCPARFQDAIDLPKAFHRPRPEVYRLKRGR